MKHLSIDLETFCAEPIGKTGAYKYIQSDTFEILLLAYSVDYGPVEVIDLASGEIIPEWLYTAIKSPEYIKHAYNAAFEWYALSKFYGEMLPLDQWRDTMLHGIYCGYTAGLDAIGKALGLTADKKKLATGKALIRYFSIPCTPTKSNGERTRNLPKHDIPKWDLFKEYCAQDVITEMAVEQRLSNFPVPDDIEIQWRKDIEINTRGVAVDNALVNGALRIGGISRIKLENEARIISKLENPNSTSQLQNWLENKTQNPFSNLRKDTVNEILKNDDLPGDVRRMLEIRQELGKTSVKKYDAIKSAVCHDGRVRGLLQFYGANRTGRWAGRLVQVQNLPRTYIEQLKFARNVVKDANLDTLTVSFGSVANTLSQLIRTAFIASDGNVLIDADFSSIEARVISWLAGENWKLDVFRTHGKIYEAAASQMFGVPIEKIKKGNPEYSLRAKGKIAELALGYQGGANALIAMGALNMGIPEADLSDIVSRWRSTNKRIVDLWHKIENAAISVISDGQPVGVNNLIFSMEFDLAHGLNFLTITLPSRRKLFYVHPKLGENRWGKPSIIYKGTNQTTKQWTDLETYGGKLVENIVQAIARDCLATAIMRLENSGFKIVFHIHDEVVIDCPRDKANLDKVVALMTQPISWAKGLPLNADGWIGDFFRKD